MKGYTALRNLYGSLTNNTASSNLTLGDQLINQSIRTIATLNNGNWWWLEKTYDVTTVASQNGYEIPNIIRKLIDLYITVGTQIYMPEAVFDADKWKLVLAYKLGTSDVPRFYYRMGNKVYFSPITASNGNTITFRGRINIRDLNTADYTTGTVTSIANGTTTLVANGTAFTADMAGRYIRITQTSAAGGGDGYWYEIASITNATTLELVKPYQGTTLAAATAAYTISQVSLIPESYDDAPVFRAAAIYWTQQKDLNIAKTFWMMYDGGKEAGYSREYGGLIGNMIEENSETVEGMYTNPFASNVNSIDPNWPQPTASGPF